MENNPVLFANIGNIKYVYFIKILFSLLKKCKKINDIKLQ